MDEVRPTTVTGGLFNRLGWILHFQQQRDGRTRLILSRRRLDRPGTVTAESLEVPFGQVNHRSLAAPATLEQAVEDQLSTIHAGSVLIGSYRALCRSHRIHSPHARAALCVLVYPVYS